MSVPRPRDRHGRPLPRGSRNELARTEEPGPVARSAGELLRRGIELFDQRRFFEAHEAFEQLWKSDGIDTRERRLWKGVTQVAVGCCHAQRGNARGALALLERAQGYLRDGRAARAAVDAAALAAAARGLAARLRQRGASADLDFPRFPTS